MSGRKNLPGLMEEAFGRVSIPEPRARAKVVRMPTEPNSAPSDTVKKMLAELRLGGMAAAYDKQTAKPESVALSFEMRLKHMLECEAKLRARRRFKTRLRQAGLRLPATVEMIDYDYARGLDRGQIQELATCDWIKQHQDLIICGPVGTGKTFLACALAHQACVLGYKALYRRLPDLLRELAQARREDRWEKTRALLQKKDLLIIDDLGLDPLDQWQKMDLLDLLENRHGRRSTLVASQAPEADWPEVIGWSTPAQAIVDRLAHQAHRITLAGHSMRRRRRPSSA